MTALNTFRDETVVVAAAAEIFPTTVKLFWMVAVDTVRSPLMVAALETFRDEIVVIPVTVRLF